MMADQREQLDDAFNRLEALRGTLALHMEAEEIGPVGRLAMQSIDYAICDIALSVDRARSANQSASPS